MTKSVATTKAFKRRPQRILALAIAGVATIVLAACGSTSSAGSSHQQSHAPTHPPTTAPAHSVNPIPQGNGGDGDADNNGGPSDGDGNI
ncbi:MAG TPA: hypothetical protein VJ254_06345 [Streptosporangiaceae bacterium]|nr:hypothetical protein [Streptosporangiaceae bacterium]